eukprot:g8494.t1
MKKLSVVHELPPSKEDKQEEAHRGGEVQVLRTFKRKTLRPGHTSQTRAQERTNLIRALSDFPPNALNGFDESFALLDGGVGVAVSAAMAKRNALTRHEVTPTNSDGRVVGAAAAKLRQSISRHMKDLKEGPQEPDLLQQVAEKLTKSSKEPKATPKRGGLQTVLV